MTYRGITRRLLVSKTPDPDQDDLDPTRPAGRRSRLLNPLRYLARSTRNVRARGGMARAVTPPEFPDQLVLYSTNWSCLRGTLSSRVVRQPRRTEHLHSRSVGRRTQAHGAIQVWFAAIRVAGPWRSTSLGCCVRQGQARASRLRRVSYWLAGLDRSSAATRLQADQWWALRDTWVVRQAQRRLC